MDSAFSIFDTAFDALISAYTVALAFVGLQVFEADRLDEFVAPWAQLLLFVVMPIVAVVVKCVW